MKLVFPEFNNVKEISSMGISKILFGNSTDSVQQPNDNSDSGKGIFDGGDEVTVEDMIIMDILDEHARDRNFAFSQNLTICGR